MDFAALQAIANAQYDENTHSYAFDPAPFASSTVTALVQDVIKQPSWNLTAVSGLHNDPTARTITFQGQCGQFYGQTNVALKMILSVDVSGEAQVIIELTLPSGWTFTRAFPQLQGTVFDDVAVASHTDALYVFASAVASDPDLKNGAFVPGLNWYGAITPGGNAFGQATALVGAVTDTTAVGPLAVTALGPNMTLTLGVQQTLAQYFPILSGVVEIQLVSNFQPGGTVGPPIESLDREDPSRSYLRSMPLIEATADDGVQATVGLWLGTHFDLGANKGLTIGTLLTPLVRRVIYFEAEFQGVMLPAPQEAAQDFLNLIGGNDLYTALPSEYQSASHLALKKITLGIGTRTLKPTTVSLLIGTPVDDPGWALGSVATVTGVELLVKVTNPFESASRTILVSVTGTTEIATTDPKQPVEMVIGASAIFSGNAPTIWEVHGGLADGSVLTIPIGNWLDKYLPAAIDMPNITLDSMGMAFVFQSPQNHYSLYAGLDPNHPVSFKFGGSAILTILYAAFAIDNYRDNGSWGGSLEGSVQIFSVQTDFSVEMPGGFKLTAAIPQFDIDLPQLVEGLVGPGWGAPAWLPTITFPATDLYIARQVSGANSNYTFALRAQPSFGAVVLQVVYQGNAWAFAAALQLNSPKIAAFDGLSVLDGMDALFAVQELLFVFASADMPGGFQFPPTAAFNGATGPNIIVPSWAGPVKGGFYFFGAMQLNTAKSKNLELVQKMFQLSLDLTFDLLVYLSMNPAKDAYAQASMTGKINDVTTISGVIGARMEDEEPQFYLAGSVSTQIRGSDATHTLVSCDKQNLNDCLTATLFFELTEAAAFLAVSMIGAVTFGPVTLADIVLVVGIDFEGIPSLGFAAQIDLTAYGTTYDSSIAFFFDSGDPAKSLFAGSISDVTLKQIADTLVGVVSGGDQPPQWLDDLLAKVGVSGTNTFYLPLSASTALDGRDLAGVTKAFNVATGGSQYAFSNQTTLLVVGATDLERPGVWFLTDFPANDVITHYELYADSANNRIKVSLEAQFYYCMPPGGGRVVLGPPNGGLSFNSGVFVNGMIDFFMLHLAVTIKVQQNKGVYVDLLVTDPIRLIPHLIELTGNQDATHGPHFSMSTYTIQTTDPSTNKPVTLPPHFYLDGKIVFIGLIIATTVNVDSHGLNLVFDASVGDSALGAEFNVHASLDSVTDFDLGFSGNVHIDDPDFSLFSADMGTIDLKLDISAGFALGARQGSPFLHVADMAFTIDGTGFTVPGFDLNLSTDTLEDLPGIVYDAVKALIWDFLRDVEHFLEWVGDGIIQGVEDIERVLEEVYYALSSVWANEKRIVVAVHQSFAASQATTIVITPAHPTADVTQDMIDDAHDWAEQTAEYLVTQAIIAQIKQTPPADIADFQVNSVQNIDETFDLEQTVNWYVVAQGDLPSLASLGYQNPFSDARFFTQSQTAARFQVSVGIDADFGQSVQHVTVVLRYNEADIGTHTFLSNVPYLFAAPWSSEAGETFQMQYTVAYNNPGVPPINTSWINMRGQQVIVPIVAPAPLAVTLDGATLPFDRILQAEVSSLSFIVAGQQVPAAQSANIVTLTHDHPRVTILSAQPFPAGTKFSYTYQLYFTCVGETPGQLSAPVTDDTQVAVVQPPHDCMN